MKPCKETELYNQLRDNLQIRYDSGHGTYSLIRTDAVVRFERSVDTRMTRDLDYIQIASDRLLEDAVESVRRMCGIEAFDDYKIKMYDAAMKCCRDEDYRSIPVVYLETMYRMIVNNAPHVLSTSWKDAFMAGIKEANRKAGRNDD